MPKEDISRYRKILKTIIHPKTDISTADNSLRFTDILFGFVIKEIFIRLAQWPKLPNHYRFQLLACSALVLGSWIGFRRSTNRKSFEVKFVNYPLIKFLIDQLMILFYFKIAILTPIDLEKNIIPDWQLVEDTLFTIFIVFLLYFIWDFIGIRMAVLKQGESEYRYPAYKDKEKNALEFTKQETRDFLGMLITLLFMIISWIFYFTYKFGDGYASLIWMGVSLMIYRFVKEIRTSLRYELNLK